MDLELLAAWHVRVAIGVSMADSVRSSSWGYAGILQVRAATFPCQSAVLSQCSSVL